MEQLVNTDLLIEQLLCIDYQGQKIDLHNDYECVSLNYTSLSDFVLTFRGIGSKLKAHDISLNFLMATIIRMELDFGLPLSKLTLDNFHRARYEENGKLYDITADGRKCFVLEFYEDIHIELLAQDVALMKVRH